MAENFFTEKVGPLPVWAWMGAGTVLILFFVSKGKGNTANSTAAQSQQAALTAAQQAAALSSVGSSGYGNSYGSGGGGGYYGNGYSSQGTYSQAPASSITGNIPAPSTSTPVTTPSTAASTTSTAASTTSTAGIQTTPPTTETAQGAAGWAYTVPNLVGLSYTAAQTAVANSPAAGARGRFPSITYNPSTPPSSYTGAQADASGGAGGTVTGQNIPAGTVIYNLPGQPTYNPITVTLGT